jgi:redox-sensitive bicupin YhaK (pirin superfamily)
VGSGIEHAEGGGTPKGMNTTGFQIWINVPSSEKMKDPRYGTEPPENLPVVEPYAGVFARVLAGEYNGLTGPFKTVQDVQMIDFKLAPRARHTHELPAALDNCLIYVADGSVETSSSSTVADKNSVLHLDASGAARTFDLSAGPAGASLMLFAGKRIKEPIAWHGPFVMNTQKEIDATLRESRAGKFPPKRVSWDYKKIETFPKSHRQSEL